METSADFDELMRRIRSVAHATRAAGRPADPEVLPPSRSSGAEQLDPPPRPVTKAQDDVEIAALKTVLAEAASMLPRARQKTEVTGAPKILRPLYRNQGGFNGVLLAAAERLLEASQGLQRQNAQLHERLDALESALTRQHDWTVAIAAMQRQQREWMTALEACLLEIGGSQDRQEFSLKLRPPETAFQAEMPIPGSQDMQARIGAVDDHANRLGDHLKNLQAQVDDQEERSADWHSHYRQTTAHHDLLDEMTRRLEERQRGDASYFRNQLWLLQRLVEPLLKGKGEAVQELDRNNIPAASKQELDALYLAFEDAMRGSRDTVKERTRVYLTYLSAVNAGSAERPVLDLGCGRGEWLELLREQGLVATGVDLNTCMIEVCKERGFAATLADALDHLGTLANESCGAVTAFHLIEHLPFPVLIRFFRECRRVLQPGGVAIFETPNPYNVLVGSGYFYHDFTHQRPLPPTSTKFLAEQMGFGKVDILFLHPWDESAKVQSENDEALARRFNELFYGPQDYALIATP